ncbi:MAG: hypothetical protein HY290_26985 [Planctomycetia bacterium]|nr:hypothetical protein [Planctomycetia bacterium]
MSQLDIRPLNHPCSLTELHEWLVHHAPLVGKCAAFECTPIEGESGPLFDDPRIAKARDEWQNARPFPDNRQISLLAMLFSPDHSLEKICEPLIRAVSVALSLMGLPAPLTQILYTDLHWRTFTTDVPVDRTQIFFLGGPEIDDDLDEPAESGHVAAKTSRSNRLSAHFWERN